MGRAEETVLYNQRTSDKFSGRSSSINKSKEMDIDEMIDKMSTKLERAAQVVRCSA
jgi:precorrin-4 methylase